MKINALLKIADMLDNLSPEEIPQFDMRYWDSHFPGECRTSACAIGWAFKKKIVPRGLKFKKGEPTWGKKKNYWALAAAFNINIYSIQYLFASWAYPGLDVMDPSAVATRIRNFVKTRGELRSRPRDFLTNV
jgi:hypothetical protein